MPINTIMMAYQGVSRRLRGPGTAEGDTERQPGLSRQGWRTDHAASCFSRLALKPEFPLTFPSHPSLLVRRFVRISVDRVIRFFDGFHLHQQRRQNGDQGQEARDGKEVLEHGDSGLYQRRLGLLEGRSNCHVGGQTVESLYAPGGQRRQSPAPFPPFAMR